MKEILGLDVSAPVAAGGFGIAGILTNMLLALIIGILMAYVHRKTAKGFGASNEFFSTIVLMTMTTCVIMMIIGNNLVLSLGLVGALSIIRFRTVIKSNRDLTFLFMGIAGGLGAGSGSYLIVCVGMATLLTITLLMSKGEAWLGKEEELLLMTSVRSEHMRAFQELLRVSFKHSEQRASVGGHERGMTEMTYAVRLIPGQTTEEATAKLAASNVMETFSLHLPDRMF